MSHSGRCGDSPRGEARDACVCEGLLSEELWNRWHCGVPVLCRLASIPLATDRL
jgi:hypothetical protein